MHNLTDALAVSPALKAAALIILIIGAVHIISALTFDRIIYIKNYNHKSPKIKADLSGFKIAFISDIHFIPQKRLLYAVNTINEHKADILLIGGDFARGRHLENALKALSGVKTKHGTYVIEGNHDNKSLEAGCRKYGLKLLENKGLSIEPGLYIAGVKDLKSKRTDIRKALKGAENSDFVVLMAHNPDTAMRDESAGSDLILSGHTHNGHVTFFGIWKPLLVFVSRYGGKFGGGWAENHMGVPVYVSSGLGTHRFRPRVFARPEIAFIKLALGNDLA